MIKAMPKRQSVVAMYGIEPSDSEDRSADGGEEPPNVPQVVQLGSPANKGAGRLTWMSDPPVVRTTAQKATHDIPIPTRYTGT